MSDLHTLEKPRSAPQTKRKGRAGTVVDREGRSKDWTIKGLPAETVEVARDAARESGMKINAWVTQVFEKAASGPLPQMSQSKAGYEVKGIDLSEEVRMLRLRNDELVQTISNLSQAIAKMADNR